MRSIEQDKLTVRITMGILPVLKYLPIYLYR